MLKLFSKMQAVCLLLLILFLALFVGAASSAFGVTNPGYRGLSYNERQVAEISAFGGIRVNGYNGNLILQRNIFYIPGMGIPGEFYLTYNSDHRNISSPFGRGWNLSYNIRYTLDSSGNVTIVWGDGRQDTFTNSGGLYTSPTGVYMTLTSPASGQFLLTTKRGIKYRFTNSTHRKLTSIEDPNGNTMAFAHNTDYQLTTVTCSGGRTYNLSYNPAGMLTSITDSNLGGRTYSFTYDASGRLTGITDSLGKTETFSYNSESLLTGITDRRGNSATISYTTPGGDPDTRLPLSISKGGSTTGFSFAGNITTVTDPNSNTWKYTYTSGKLTSIEDPDNNTSIFTWDLNNNLLTNTDRNGNTTTLSNYDTNGNPQTITDPLSKAETRSYDATFSRVTAFTDRNGNPWSFTYDSKGNLITVTDPLTDQTAFAYDAMGQPITSTNPLSETTQYEYDTNGNLKKITDPLSAVTNITYDGASRPTNITDPNGNSRQSAYDMINRLITVTDGEGNTTTTTYDDNNNVVSITDGNGEVWDMAYNALNNITSATDPLGNTETYTYDANGNRLTTVDRNGNTTSFAYNSLGRMTTKTLPLSRVYQFTYDDNGNLVTRLDPLGQTVSNTFDANNRCLTRTIPGPIATTFGYDDNGNRLSASNTSSTISRTYDALNRVLTINDSQLSKTLTLVYNTAGRKASATNPEGDTQTYTYDTAGHVTRITADGENFDYTYDTGGRRTLFSRPDSTGSLATAYGYDDADRITSVITTLSGSTAQSFAYVFDANGNITQETREDATTSTMTFDDASRLTRETRTGSPAYDIAITRDARGNRLTATGTPFFPTSLSTFSYNTGNEIVQETGTGFSGAFTRDYTYNANGNNTQRVGGDSDVDFTYDPLNRITSATDSLYGTENYAYNAWDQLFSIIVSSPVPGEPGTQRYFYDEQGNIIASYDENGILIEQFWHNIYVGPASNSGIPIIGDFIDEVLYDEPSYDEEEPEIEIVIISHYRDNTFTEGGPYLKYKKGSISTYPGTDGKGPNGGDTTFASDSSGGSATQGYNTEGGIEKFGDVGPFSKKKILRNRPNLGINHWGKGFDTWTNPGRSIQVTEGAGRPGTGTGTEYFIAEPEMSPQSQSYIPFLSEPEMPTQSQQPTITKAAPQGNTNVLVTFTEPLR